MPISINQARAQPGIVRQALVLDGAVAELCAFPEVREETLRLAEPETVLVLGLSRLLSGSEGRLAGDPRRPFARFGSLALRPAGVPLEIHVGQGAFDTLRIRFTAARIAPALDGLTIDDVLLAACLDLRAPAIEEAMLRLAGELDHPAGDTVALGEALVSLIVLDLARHLREAAIRSARRQGGLSARVLRKATGMIEQAATPLTVADLAQACGLSRAHFIRCFQESTGMSPGAAIRWRRVERAKLLLGDPARSLDSIARDLGYAGAPSFSAAFRRETGRSPGAWRMQQR